MPSRYAVTVKALEMGKYFFSLLYFCGSAFSSPRIVFVPFEGHYLDLGCGRV